MFYNDDSGFAIVMYCIVCMYCHAFSHFFPDETYRMRRSANENQEDSFWSWFAKAVQTAISNSKLGSDPETETVTANRMPLTTQIPKNVSSVSSTDSQPIIETKSPVNSDSNLEISSTSPLCSDPAATHVPSVDQEVEHESLSPVLPVSTTEFISPDLLLHGGNIGTSNMLTAASQDTNVPTHPDAAANMAFVSKVGASEETTAGSPTKLDQLTSVDLNPSTQEMEPSTSIYEMDITTP